MRIHTHFRRGQRVLLMYRDGRREVHKFVDRLSDAIELEGGITVRVAKLRSVSIFKLQGTAGKA